MRTTVRIDDELLERLKEQARKENVSLARLVNRTLRAGMRAPAARGGRKPRYRERVYAMGAAAVNLDKALAVASALEDEEVLREMSLRK